MSESALHVNDCISRTRCTSEVCEYVWGTRQTCLNIQRVYIRDWVYMRFD